uniref:ribosomal protein L2 n=1 Tax=Asplenium castaneoviride TaxID=2601855 RepID=UPI0023AA7C18|nr:ribosomal protein L2 [Asplenium castaneoviride]YP_010702289.1 ribosomal protein L2 [Asplenium ruprechtii]WCL38424.1 ribosomal protein L2 [Asplenium castaneoviride]WCL38512.1 ribosomal protein L2 [Asplenium castaneoviride]WCL38600.1 ribosomal protein L2 [Asplenium ruprechtii]
MATRLYETYILGTQNQNTTQFVKWGKSKPHKQLTYHRLSRNGRNNAGIITSKHRGGGHKRLRRKVDFQRKKLNISGRVASIEYDPNRNAFICLIIYIDGDKRYILHPRGIRVGDIVTSSSDASISIGNALPLTKIPLGTIIHNVELKSGKGGQSVRAAGTAAKVIAKEGQFTTLRLPSNEIRLISQRCLASIGRVGNIDANNQELKKAGSKRWLGKRPKVRGSATNPVDHPHGGGEGKTSIGRKRPSTPWGHVTFGKRTRRKRRYSNPFILRRRKG